MTPEIIATMNRANEEAKQMRELEAYANQHLIDLLTAPPLKSRQLVEGYWLMSGYYGFSIVSNQPQTRKGWRPFTGDLHGHPVREGFYEFPLWSDEPMERLKAWQERKA